MDSPEKFTVRLATWRDDQAALQDLRRAVFIVEQQVPESLEWDEADAVCIHALALDAQGKAVATGRLLPDGHIGRMAVLKQWRSCGVGSAILECLVGCARQQGLDVVQLNAQTHALGFYARHGFLAHGAEFVDAGIPHRKMKLRL